MDNFFFVMWKPFLACLILTGIHAYLGIHVIERQVIFVDLALAQIAALGAVMAVVLGFDMHGSATYWFSLAATTVGAVIFSLTRSKTEKIPQEAVIGIVYVLAAACSILILSGSAEGDEHIRHMLVGNILLVQGPEILEMAVIYVLVGLFHWVFQKNFFRISLNPQEAFSQGFPVRWWDLLFYLTFGLVVTSSVRVAGVFLVFTFLIIPSLSAMLFTKRLRQRLVFAWVMGTVASFLGMTASYFFDLPTGPAVVCTFGVLLCVLALVKGTVFKDDRRR